jgi:hypothetical protein
MEKLNPEVTERKEATAAAFAEVLDAFEKLRSLQDLPGWLALKKLLERRQKVAQTILDNYQKYEPRAIDRALCQVQDLKFIIESVEDADANSANLTFELQRLQAELEARRAEHAKQSN